LKRTHAIESLELDLGISRKSTMISTADDAPSGTLADGPAGTSAPAGSGDADGDGRERRGLRRGPRSLIARRRGAKGRGADGEAANSGAAPVLEGAPARERAPREARGEGGREGGREGNRVPGAPRGPRRSAPKEGAVAGAAQEGAVPGVGHADGGSTEGGSARGPRRARPQEGREPRQGQGPARRGDSRREGSPVNRERKPAGPVRAAGVPDEDVFSYVTSPAFDADNGTTGGVRAPMLRRGARKPDAAPKRVLTADDDHPKLHKVLAEAGMGSRREMEELIVTGFRSTANLLISGSVFCRPIRLESMASR